MGVMEKHNRHCMYLTEVKLDKTMTSMVIESYGEHNRFQIGFGDFEAAMFLWMGNYGSRHRIILASIVVVPHHIDLIEKNWTKILGNIISTG